MGYIEDLRKKIGHDPVLMVGSGVLITDAEGRLLMGKRSDNHAWGIPGGSTELGETVEETALRETKEETGLEIGAMTLFGVFSGPELFYTYPNGDQVYNVSVVFHSSDYHGQVSENGEHSRFRFFAPGELPQEISPPVRPVVEAWLRKVQK